MIDNGPDRVIERASDGVWFIVFDGALQGPVNTQQQAEDYLQWLQQRRDSITAAARVIDSGPVPLGPQ